MHRISVEQTKANYILSGNWMLHQLWLYMEGSIHFLIFHAHFFIFSYICVFIRIWNKQRWCKYILIIRDNAMQRTFPMHQRFEQKIKENSSNEAHQTKPIPIMLNLLQKTELIFEFHLLHLNIFFDEVTTSNNHLICEDTMQLLLCTQDTIRKSNG